MIAQTILKIIMSKFWPQFNLNTPVNRQNTVFLISLSTKFKYLDFNKKLLPTLHESFVKISKNQYVGYGHITSWKEL